MLASWYFNTALSIPILCREFELSPPQKRQWSQRFLSTFGAWQGEPFYWMIDKVKTMTTVNYETDIIAWANEQARLIRSGNFELLLLLGRKEDK